MTIKNVSPELLEPVRRDRGLIAAELPELEERHQRMAEAKSEDTFSGHLRQAIYGSRRRRIGK